jgi:predicted transcriptional regulator
MLHNKYYSIIALFLGDYTKEVYGREINIGMSQKAVALTLNELEKEGILRSRKVGTVKYFRLNAKLGDIKDQLIISEIYRKSIFLAKERKLAHAFKGDERIIGIFGSYAKSRKKHSDVDVFIIGKKKLDDAKGELLDLPLSVKHFSDKEFRRLLQEKNNLMKEIVKYHIIISGFESFVRAVWGDFYGLD